MDNLQARIDRVAARRRDNYAWMVGCGVPSAVAALYAGNSRAKTIRELGDQYPKLKENEGGE